jgi:hypothetical protein
MVNAGVLCFGEWLQAVYHAKAIVVCISLAVRLARDR